MKIHVNLKQYIDTSYDIQVGTDIFSQIPDFIKTAQYGNRYMIISDQNVAELYGENLITAMQLKGLEVEMITFRPGDENKTLKTADNLLTELLKRGYNRKDALIALGGGVTGDLVGFVASTFMRGVPFIQIPTSLLAMVDASIGGKTGVNHSIGKNLIGTFYQPKAVFIDPGLLTTLAQPDYLNGLSEIVKYGAIADEKLFSLLEDNINPIIERDSTLLIKIIHRCCEIKAEIVSEDEKEKGKRMILNYGHTIGHSLEKISKYRIPHGQAIAMGMKLINFMGLNHGLTDNDTSIRINNLINSFGICGPEETRFMRKVNAGKIWNALQSDKKADTKVKFIVIPKTGDAAITDELEKADIARALKQYI